MALPESEWLHLAKRLAIHQTSRQRHGTERRTNMIVGNDDDRWWCYCQSCKTGGVVKKEHVRVTGIAAPHTSTDLSMPFDMVRVLDATKDVQDGVLGFLAHKNMDAVYLPELWFSKSRMRVLIQHEYAWLGRDTTERSMQKWLTYNGGTTHLASRLVGKRAVVVEDAFSFFKVQFALRSLADVTVYCSLGTALSDKLMIELLKCDAVGMFYDGDAAGYLGSLKESHRLRSCGITAISHCAPAGLDPKDMGIKEIIAYCREFKEKSI